MIGFPKTKEELSNCFQACHKDQALSQQFFSLMKDQMSYYVAQGLPLRNTEGWRYFPTQSLSKSDHSFNVDSNDLVEKRVEPFLEDSFVISIQNGKPYIRQQPKGLSCFSWSDFLDGKISLESKVKNNIYNGLKKQRNSLSALNNVLSSNGLILLIEKSMDKPLEIQYLQNFYKQSQALNLRVFIFLKKNVKATIFSHFVGNQNVDEKLFLNLQTDCYLDDDSHLEYFFLDQGHSKDIFMNQFFVDLQPKASINKMTVNLSSSINRSLTEVFQEKNSVSYLRGLAILGNKDYLEQKTLVVHKDTESTSDQLYQSFLFEKAKFIFNGFIDIKKKAQQSSAKQLNKNLLFSDQAFAVSCPELGVEADDVVAEHGSTTSSLEDQKHLLFYLQSRGLSLKDSYYFILSSMMNDLFSLTSTSIEVPIKKLLYTHLNELKSKQGLH